LNTLGYKVEFRDPLSGQNCVARATGQLNLTPISFRYGSSAALIVLPEFAFIIRLIVELT